MPERDSLEVDVLFVGAGPASLAGAIRLCQLAKEQNREISVMVIEKAGEIGYHGLSGAVMDPRGLTELIPDWKERGAPVESPVTSDALWFLTGGGKFAAPIVPPMMNNSGKYVTSLQKLTKWMGEQAEALGADVFPSFPGQELLWDGDRITGVRIGDKGVDKHGKPKANYEPGPDLFAKITVLGEGPRGTLAKQATARLNLEAGKEAQVYACGVKEIWQCAPGSVKAGSVIHTLGYPLPSETFGGGWIYGMAGDILDLGLVIGLDYKDPTTDPHNEFQRFKQHPAIRKMLEGAKLLRYGAKAIPEGGLFAMPCLSADGMMLVGDSGGFLNGMRLKGIHLAIKSGMMAAETAFEALAAEKSDAQSLSEYEDKFKKSWAFSELHAARNFHQGFAGGTLAGMLNVGLGMVTGGRGFGIKDRLAGEPGYERMQKAGYKPKESPRAVIDNVITFDKLTDVYNSGTMHDEDQPAHLHVADTTICASRCTVEYGNPCQYFCPAKVYEPMFEKKNGGVEGHLQINFTNCVHCKTCDIMDPYQIITWVPPQGGEGPVYTNM
ncbi:MAG: electron transfer flavoprotein-ubiquinone oxidoreductase [Candidatus Eremiobacteraeota bacterium]|nr:electron transfer flavoprotein-ubiquinone oxidoreductase [Candidatus Eremiobacteraeota bacterium]